MNKLKKPQDAASTKQAASTGASSHWRRSDLVAAAKLATQATISVTHLVEEVHQSVLGTLGFKGKDSGTSANQVSRGMTGLVYQAIRTITQWVGGAIDTSYNLAQPLLSKSGDNDAQASSTSEREAVLAALNGVIGDRLASAGSPLATPMRLRYLGQVLDPSEARSNPGLGSKCLLVIHGLCMNDLQWSRRKGKSKKSLLLANKPGTTQQGSKAKLTRTETATPSPTLTSKNTELSFVEHNHAEMLARTLGYTPIYLRYNTGLSIADNGRELSRQLERLMNAFPEVKQLSVLAHSMGGLIIRSALSQPALQAIPDGIAKTSATDWRGRLARIVFLGTPHHGAPLERAGQWVDLLLGSTPFSAPFKRLSQLRSAGITDLRYGHLTVDHRLLPLREGVPCFCAAACTAAQRSVLADRLLGDGLVPLNSALGIHKSPSKSLNFPKEHQRIFYKMNHMELLSRPEVSEQLLEWFA